MPYVMRYSIFSPGPNGTGATTVSAPAAADPFCASTPDAMVRIRSAIPIVFISLLLTRPSPGPPILRRAPMPYLHPQCRRLPSNDDDDLCRRDVRHDAGACARL